LIDFEAALRAVKVAVQSDFGAAGAFTLARGVHHDAFVSLNIQKMFPGLLFLFIDAFQFECVEPDAAATALAHIQHQVSDLPLNQFIEASWAFHNAKLPQTLDAII
jgi:hypothetical protein